MAEVRLRPVRDDEWVVWRESSIEQYGAELSRNEGMAPGRARVRAAREFDELLPDGAGTTGHRILVAEDIGTGERIGHVWFGPRTRDPDPAIAWIYEIQVEEPLRGRGLGRLLMSLLEDEVRTAGVSRLELNVAGDNERARHLYETVGYSEMARQMAKDLDV